MKYIKFVAIVLCFLSVTDNINAQPQIRLRPNETILLYADSFEGNVDPVFAKEVKYAGFDMKEDNGLTGPERIRSNGALNNVSNLARVDIYLPKKGTGQMVVICPGGGYKGLTTYNGGLYTAEWLLSKGIAVAIAKYRMPNGHWTVPLEDIHNVLRYCRSRAQEWGIDQIGVMGFSAGGHLAACASNLYVDKVTRPDFCVLIYPVITYDYDLYRSGSRPSLLGAEDKWEGNMQKFNELVEYYSLENQVHSNTPPTFLAHCTDDKTLVVNSILYYNKLFENNVYAELHAWPEGGHAWGFSKTNLKRYRNDKFAYARTEFCASLERWLRKMRTL
jgi:acetyl esterase/lipase